MNSPRKPETVGLGTMVQRAQFKAPCVAKQKGQLKIAINITLGECIKLKHIQSSLLKDKNSGL